MAAQAQKARKRALLALSGREADGQAPPVKPRLTEAHTLGLDPSPADETTAFLKSWVWKREHRPDRDRFQKPYIHEVLVPGSLTAKVTIRQDKFAALGFASTVWDSSIVVSKMLEHRVELVRSKRCLDLSAGCGLVGITAALLGASCVILTDLAPNLPLLQHNCDNNSVPEGGRLEVIEHTWGEPTQGLGPPFDVIFATDVMYVREAVPALLISLRALCASTGAIILAHGRNRFAEDTFMTLSAPLFSVRPMEGSHELHPDYQCTDVTVYWCTPIS